jgi:hypothetical protein
MHHWKRAILPAAAAAVAVVALLLVGITTISAAGAGAGAVSYTQTFHNATDVQPFGNPCTNEPGTVTLTYNGVFHATELTSGQGAGTFWVTGTMTGDFVITPDDASQPSYTGHFATWFGDNNNLHNGTETSTLSVHGTGSDGSTLRFHDVAHLSASASGLTVFFDKPSCG